MKSFKSILILLLYAAPIIAQPNLDFRTLGRRALSNGEYTAATYFLYADYLRDTINFDDHIVTAFLLTNEAEYDKAERMYANVQDTICTEYLSDSLKYFYYTGLAELAHHRHQYVDAINYTRDIIQAPAITRYEQVVMRVWGFMNMLLLNIRNDHVKRLMTNAYTIIISDIHIELGGNMKRLFHIY